jgi:hypothetical protein
MTDWRTRVDRLVEVVRAAVDGVRRRVRERRGGVPTRPATPATTAAPTTTPADPAPPASATVPPGADVDAALGPYPQPPRAPAPPVDPSPGEAPLPEPEVVVREGGRTGADAEADRQPPVVAPEWQPPAAWVGPDGNACPASHPVKAKLGSRIFHVPGMANYARTVPDRCYVDASAAEGDGFRRAKR